MLSTQDRAMIYALTCIQEAKKQNKDHVTIQFAGYHKELRSTIHELQDGGYDAYPGRMLGWYIEVNLKQNESI